MGNNKLSNSYGPPGKRGISSRYHDKSAKSSSAAQQKSVNVSRSWTTDTASAKKPSTSMLSSLLSTYLSYIHFIFIASTKNVFGKVLDAEQRKCIVLMTPRYALIKRKKKKIHGNTWLQVYRRVWVIMTTISWFYESFLCRGSRNFLWKCRNRGRLLRSFLFNLLTILPRFLLFLLKVVVKSLAVVAVIICWRVICDITWRAVKIFFVNKNRSLPHHSHHSSTFAVFGRRKMAWSTFSTTASSTSPRLPQSSALFGGGRSSSLSGMQGNLSSSFPNTTEPQQNGMKINDSNRFTMECHVDWIGDLIPMYLTPPEKEKYVNGAIDKLKEWLDEIKGVVTSPGSALNVSLMLASFYGYLSKFNEALEWVDEAEDRFKSLENECAQHRQAYSYLIQANLYKIKRRMKLLEGVSMKTVEQEAAQDLMEIRKLYSEDDGSFQAVICFAKAMLAGHMLQQERQLKLYKRAIELEPGCAQWYRLLYQCFRKRRRERNWYCPCTGERNAIAKAYELEPDCCLNQSFYASMLEEYMKGNKELILSSTKQEEGDKIVLLLTTALEKNPAHKWTHVRLAEIYAYGNFPHFDPKDGELMFEELEERWPDSSMVLHKFGKYFVVARSDHKKALEYYTRALECESANFPCVMDYLKTFQHVGKGKDYKDMLTMVEKCLGYLHNSAPMSRLLLAKGILLWLMDEEEVDVDMDGGTREQTACQAWVDAVEEDPKSCKFIAKMISSGYWNIIGDYFIDVTKVIDNLSVFLSASNDSDEIRYAKQLISELRSPEQSNRPHSGGPRQRTLSTCSSRSNLSDCSYVTAKSSWSQVDDNWRGNLPPFNPLVGGSGIFAKYEDPAEVQFKCRFKIGLSHGVNPKGIGEPLGESKRMHYQTKTASIADLDNDWRR